MKRIFSTMLLAFTTWLTGCAFGPPFKKTALAREGGLAPDRPVLVVVSSTEHRPGMRGEFFKDTKAVLATMSEQPGLLGHAVRFELFGNKAWTITAWKDEAALSAFVRSPAHREAVRRSGETAQNIRFASTEMPLAALPMSWAEARRRLDEATPGYRKSARSDGSNGR
jgi:heme-degrading monooxygenase HmoA